MMEISVRNINSSQEINKPLPDTCFEKVLIHISIRLY